MVVLDPANDRRALFIGYCFRICQAVLLILTIVMTQTTAIFEVVWRLTACTFVFGFALGTIGAASLAVFAAIG